MTYSITRLSNAFLFACFVAAGIFTSCDVPVGSISEPEASDSTGTEAATMEDSLKIEIIDLGTLGGDPIDEYGQPPYSFGRAVNNKGEVVGMSSSAEAHGRQHAFLWKDSAMTDLGAFEYTTGSVGDPKSKARDINDQGLIVGAGTGWNEYRDGDHHAVLWKDGEMIDLGLLTVHNVGDIESEAFAVNEHGQIVGYSGRDAFLWEEGTMTDIGDLKGAYASRAYDINNKGQIVGASRFTKSGEEEAFLWEDGAMTSLGTHHGDESRAVAINDAGQIVVWIITYDGERDPFNKRTHSFLWEDGHLTEIGVLEGANHSYAQDINNKGQIVGYSGRSAFLWEDGHMIELPSLGGRNGASSINDEGQIAGSSSFSNTAPGDSTHAVLWNISVKE